MRLARIAALFFLLIAALTPCRAQLLMLKEKNGKTIDCMHTGLISTTQDCGLDDYELVFIGTINQITPAPDNELKLDVTPDEIFHGEPGSTVTVMTSQGDCFDNLEAGNRWLFFLRVEKEKPLVLDFYSNPSGPTEDRAQAIETLRQLQHIGRQAILRGTLTRGGRFENNAVLNARVIATSAHQEFTALTDAQGSFEFPLLASGNYKLRALLADGKVVRESVNLPSASCRAVSLHKGPEGQIEGRIRYPDGTPAAHVSIVLMYGDDSGWNNVASDEKGRFGFGNLEPGTYLLGFDSDWTESRKVSSGSGQKDDVWLYYSGVTSRSNATSIVLTEDEQKKGIEVVLPSPPQDPVTNH